MDGMSDGQRDAYEAGRKAEQERSRYNGWTNYETWSVALIMDNDERLYNLRQEQAAELYEQAEPEYEWQSKTDKASYELAAWLKDFVADEYLPDLDKLPLGMLYSQLLGGAISSVNWDEIARHWIEEAAADAEPEEAQAE